MLYHGDIEWRLAQFEHERLLLATRAAAPRSSSGLARLFAHPAWRWTSGRRIGIELTMYLRSEWARPFVPVERIPRTGSYDGLMSFVW